MTSDNPGSRIESEDWAKHEPDAPETEPDEDDSATTDNPAHPHAHPAGEEHARNNRENESPA